jgi:hypothetical protein
LKMIGGVYSLDGSISARGEVTETVETLAEADACGVKLADLLKSRVCLFFFPTIQNVSLSRWWH